MTSDRTRERLASLEERCAAEGVQLTVQRRIVMEVLAPRGDHPTVEQVHTAVAERLPGVSKATVYRTLETLAGLGLVQRVHHTGSAARFDANVEPHHHFACTRCGAIEDLPLAAVRGAHHLRFVGTGGGRADEVAVVVRGLCARCASR